MKKFATVVAALGVMAGLTVSALPSASAATDVTVLGATPAPTDEPEPTTGATTSVSGALEVSLDGEDVVGPAKLALCQASCLDSAGTIVDSATGGSGVQAHATVTRADRTFEIIDIPIGSYLVAVNIPGLANGYLSRRGTTYDVVSTPQQATSIPVDGLSYLRLLVARGVALPDPDASYDVVARTVQAPGDPISFSAFRYTVVRAGATTKVNVKVIGCSGKVMFETTRAKSGTYTFDVTPDAHRMGRDWKLVTTISEPGRATNVSTLKKFTPDWDFSCGGSARPASVKVTKWSAKAGRYRTAKRGRTLKVSATRTESGAKTSYAWTVNGKVVDRDRSMKVKKAYVGKKVRLKVTVRKDGRKSRTRTISYGRATR